jgi:hypothetical protein
MTKQAQANMRAHGDFLRDNAGTAFGKSSAPRAMWEAPPVPSPGQYNVIQAWHNLKDKHPEHHPGHEAKCTRFGEIIAAEAIRQVREQLPRSRCLSDQSTLTIFALLLYFGTCRAFQVQVHTMSARIWPEMLRSGRVPWLERPHRSPSRQRQTHSAREVAAMPRLAPVPTMLRQTSCRGNPCTSTRNPSIRLPHDRLIRVCAAAVAEAR